MNIRMKIRNKMIVIMTKMMIMMNRRVMILILMMMSMIHHLMKNLNIRKTHNLKKIVKKDIENILLLIVIMDLKVILIRVPLKTKNK